MVGALSLLVLGAALGVAVDRLFLVDRAGADAAAEDLHTEVLESFRADLGLDDDQVRQVDSVFRLHQAEVDRLWEGVHRHLRSAVDSVHAEIEAILRPEQRDAFRGWLESQHRDRMRHAP